ncbi:MAG: glycoside hydrolase family 97 catalytic domain-containing protein [Candidatus Pedobacter colombiensis]|uniref:Glycoside hydrolase family 97 catalytic domain-containing protein n=1 Tax=Candidatus Pedobacter colombiensis TaxID=3121371 RepID=A0AAJ6B7S9_9SPHI|nr:glycoside hydrolase family 97 protein [Pedobacter sp.]WEK20194.1 MAG: glycoside hydrolase family 97 catalytic domain-containing protein [Pedobacter sp.]
MNKLKYLCLLLFALYIQQVNAQYQVDSPDQQLKVQVSLNGKKLYYNISRKGVQVMKDAELGIVRSDEDFSKDLALNQVSAVSRVSDSYTLNNGKRLLNHYEANKRIFHLQNSAGKKMDIIFQVSDAGVAFRYFFPERDTQPKTITEERTSFHFLTGTKAWLQPMAIAKSGWESTNPSYEEYYQKEIEIGKPAPTAAGWVYPALFNYKDTWLLVTEAGLDRNYCATRLQQNSPDGKYRVGLPDPRESFINKTVNPESTLPWYTPWRIIAVGSLKTVTESTLGTDLAYPALAKIDPSAFVKGRASWSWIILKDNSINYELQKKYIDFAAAMQWEYCLIDADWDRKIGYDKIRELADYAKNKKVGLLLWYNSAGDWNTVKYTPKNKLLTQQDRLKEFALLKEMGIKGIKVDFFGGDGQPMIAYYQDLFEDAARFGLSVNCHGATLPRGWQRTYPNLLTMESIKGMEFITFEQANANEEPAHATTIPFTRNIFDPMDFTPMCLYKIPKINRITSSAFELALPVIFQSGIQHLAETPEGMATVPLEVKSFLQKLPVSWEDTKLVDGYPGKLVVMARKAGNKWYIAGINGEKTEKTIQLDLSAYAKKGRLITDGAAELSFATNDIGLKKETQITMKPYGGFVIVTE